jgi:hypothetical protein
VTFSNSANRTSVDLSRVPMKTAVDNHTIGFGAQPFFPPGADYSTPGPFFNLYKLDAWHSCTQRSQPSNPYQNRKEFFLGSLPLYKDGVLAGGPGVSGDGVEQDDFVTAAGAVGLEAPPPLRADQIIDLGLRLPYLKSLVIQWTERH